MHWLDFLLLLWVAAGALFGFRAGLLRMALRLGGIALVIFFLRRWGQPETLAALASGSWEKLLPALGEALLAFGVVAALEVLIRFLRFLPGIGLLDRAAGLVLGAAWNGVLALVVLGFLEPWLRGWPFWREAHVWAWLAQARAVGIWH
jgi:uncharacterized membrane protein required for colicin V production